MLFYFGKFPHKKLRTPTDTELFPFPLGKSSFRWLSQCFVTTCVCIYSVRAETLWKSRSWFSFAYSSPCFPIWVSDYLSVLMRIFCTVPLLKLLPLRALGHVCMFDYVHSVLDSGTFCGVLYTCHFHVPPYLSIQNTFCWKGYNLIYATNALQDTECCQVAQASWWFLLTWSKLLLTLES